MKNCGLVFLLCAFIFNQGCCSVFTSGKQTISIDSKPEGATVKMGPYKGTTPVTFVVPKGKEYVIQATLGDKTETATLERGIHGAYWINILVWPGLLIDLGTGKMWKYDPEEYEIVFN